MTTDLTSFFAPRAVAILGASERNPWARYVLTGLAATGFAGGIHLVNPKSPEVLGRPTVPSVAAIPEPVDCAFLMVPAAAVEQSLRDLAAAGIRNCVVVSSGFAELGEEGAAAQGRLVDLARALGVTLMGPNSMGFVNFVGKAALTAIPIFQPVLPDPRIGLVSQSGATSAILCRIAHGMGIALTHAIATGNEAMVDIADFVEYLIDQPQVRAIALFAEGFRQPDRFLAAARRALVERKPIVMLKVGVGELAAQVAQAHTGALVGDNKVFDAICRDLGIVRVDTLEELLQTAHLLSEVGVLGEGGCAVASISGGACEMVADLGEAAGVPFVTFAPETAARIAAILPDYATVHNPLDTTGGVLADFQLFEDVIVAAGQDPGVALVAVVFEVADTAERNNFGLGPVTHLAEGIRRAGVPGFLLTQTYLTVTPYARELLDEAGIPCRLSGLGMGMRAVGAAFRWSAAVRRGPPAFALSAATPAAASPPPAERPSHERAALAYLAAHGVPTVPALLATTADEAAAHAAALGGPVVLKVLSADIAHKTEVGGVALDVAGQDAARAEFVAMLERVRVNSPAAAIEGITLSPMRGAGIELIVGVARDPTWGPVLAVGLGGVWVELLGDADLALLPVTPDEVDAMLGRLKAARLLDGYRGQPAVDRRTLAEAIAAIGNAALALGPELVSLEVNPLWVSGGKVECLDALMVWADAPGA